MKKLFVFLVILFTASEAMALVELDVMAELEIYNPQTRETARLQSSDADANRSIEGFQESVESQIVRTILTAQMRTNSCLREVMRLHSSEDSRDAFEATVKRRIPNSRAYLPNSSMTFTVALTQTSANQFTVNDVRILWRPGLVRHQRVVPLGADCTLETIREAVYVVAAAYVAEREEANATIGRQLRVNTEAVSRLGQTLGLQ